MAHTCGQHAREQAIPPQRIEAAEEVGAEAVAARTERGARADGRLPVGLCHCARLLCCAQRIRSAADEQPAQIHTDLRDEGKGAEAAGTMGVP